MKKIICLSINTADSQCTIVGIEIENKKIEKLVDAKQTRSQILLPLIEQLLREQKLKLSDISEINIHTGPGSFTGLRVGLSVAQALGKLLNVPVNGKPAGEVQVEYQESKWE